MSKIIDSSPIVPQRNKFKYELNFKKFPWTENQKKFIELALKKETKIIFLDGVAGSSKTLLSSFVSLELLNQKKCSEILYVRTVVESSEKGLGFLPGEFESKFAPFLTPLEDKLEELLPISDIKKLKDDKRIIAVPVNYLRGRSFNAKCIISDETQNFTFREITTLITRIGKFSKMILCGDKTQSDINSKSGFKKMFDIFNTEEGRNNGIYCVEFGIDDVMRGEEVKFILETLEKNKELHNNHH